MNERMDGSSPQIVRVQKARSASPMMHVERFPRVDLACQAARNDCKMKPGKYRQERSRRRVTDTNSMRTRFLESDHIDEFG